DPVAVTCPLTRLRLFFLCTARRPPTSTLFPYTTLFRSGPEALLQLRDALLDLVRDRWLLPRWRREERIVLGRVARRLHTLLEAIRVLEDGLSDGALLRRHLLEAVGQSADGLIAHDLLARRFGKGLGPTEGLLCRARARHEVRNIDVAFDAAPVDSDLACHQLWLIRAARTRAGLFFVAPAHPLPSL